MKLIIQKPDTLGAVASAICLIHCIVTPFIFLAHVTSACCDASVPLWWQSVDYIFLIISFFAVYHSAQTTSKKIMKPALWLSWFFLFIVIINERFGLLYIPKYLNYIPALVLVTLHIYNLKFCQCKNDTCCTNNG